MATYSFETMTAAQALIITPNDTITIANLPAIDENTVAFLPATAQTPDLVQVTLSGRIVIFSANIESLSQNGGITLPNGQLFVIGTPGADSFAVNHSSIIVGGPGGDNLSADTSYFIGGTGDDTLAGGAGRDAFSGGEGDDRFLAVAGQDSADGGDGFDTLALPGKSTDYFIQSQLDGSTTAFYTPAGDSDSWPVSFRNVERLHFDDGDFSTANTLRLAVEDKFASEGNSGFTEHHFSIAREGDRSAALTVTWHATSTDGTDFADGSSASGQAIFAAGAQYAEFTVRTVGDTVYEADENFSVTLESTNSWLLMDGPQEVYVANDDPAPNPQLSVGITTFTINEGQSGSTPFTFVVMRAGDTSIACGVDYAISGESSVTANAAQASDFTGNVFPSGTISFAAGETQKEITVNIHGDTDYESDELFKLTLSNPTAGAEIQTASQTVRLLNDDSAPSGDSSGDSSSGGDDDSATPPPASAGVLVGDAGPDTIQGTSGDDIINAGDGVSYLRGGEGNDIIAGGKDFDDINGNQGNDTASGGTGDDWVAGGKDNDSLTGDGGSDVVYGNLGEDSCDGGDGADIVRGGQGNDVVLGGAGNDWLSGDRGDDTVTGGAGADIFHTFGDAGIDRVMDFNLAEGDRVMLDPGTTYSLGEVGGDTVIAMGGGGQMILAGVSMSSLSGDWIFGA